MNAGSCIGCFPKSCRDPACERVEGRTSVISRIAVSVLALVVGMAAPGSARTPRAQPPGAGQTAEPPAVTPAEIQRMFDAYALVQAQEQLKLRDDQYPQFLTKFKALQDIRRRNQQERGRVVQELRRLTNDASSDEGAIRDRLKALQDVDGRAEADIRKAVDAVDAVLDVRQQARFRLFEQQMEQQKINMLVRARLQNRPARKQPGT